MTQIHATKSQTACNDFTIGYTAVHFKAFKTK